MKKQPLVLLVDDDPDILEGMKAVLETRPYRLVTARGAGMMAPGIRIDEARPSLSAWSRRKR